MAEFRRTYSQVGEDILADYYLQKRHGVTYIDIGCLWPIKHSNTYMFYERGGTGVCIDPNPTAAEDYRATRPNDVFVNVGVGEREAELTYHAFENPVFNTFSEARAAELIASGRTGRHLVATHSVPVKPLGQILRDADWRGRHGPTADFLSIDVEGFELAVVRSIDFEYVRPKLVVMEMALKVAKSGFLEAKQILIDNNYAVCGDTGHDLFLISRDLG